MVAIPIEYETVPSTEFGLVLHMCWCLSYWVIPWTPSRRVERRIIEAHGKTGLTNLFVVLRLASLLCNL